MKKSNVEVVRRAWEPSEGVCIEVGEFGDNPDYLCLRTVDAKSAEWFGRLEISMSAEFALALGEALIACAKEKQA